MGTARRKLAFSRAVPMPKDNRYEHDLRLIKYGCVKLGMRVCNSIQDTARVSL